VTESSSDRTQVFVSLLLTAEPQIYAFLRAQVLDRNDAADLFQETATVLWQKFGEFAPDSNFAAWACQIAKHKVQHYYRTRQRQRYVFGEGLLELIAQKSEEVGSEIADMRRALADCMEKLRPADREILQRCYVAGTSVQQVAEECGRPFDTIKSVLKRSRRALFECIQRTLAEEAR
jgi:RNA polymerase sigma-70 factor (ECF subfamily)